MVVWPCLAGVTLLLGATSAHASHLTTSVDGMAGAPSVEAPAADDLLLVDVMYGHLRLASSLQATQRADGRRSLPLREFAKALGFRLYVDAKAQRVHGFLSSPSDRLDIDLHLGTCKRKGVTTRFEPAMFSAHDGDLYVESDLFARMTGLTLVWKLSSLELRVQSETPLAVSATPLDDGPAAPVAQMPAMAMIESPYRLWGMPSTDVQIRSDSQIGDEGYEQSSVTIDSFGDLAFMSARYGIVAQEGGAATARLNLSRQSASGNLLGLLRATRFEVGDLSLAPVTMLTRGRRSVGLSISNSPLPNGNEVDTGRLDGSAPAGSTVELYRHDLRVGSTTVDRAGKYSFRGIDLLPGSNALYVVVIAPDGELREEPRTLYRNLQGPKPGVTQYRLTLDRTGSTLFGSDSYSPGEDRSELIAEVQKGLSSRSWVSATVAAVEGSGERSEYVGLGYHAWDGAYLWHADAMLDDGGAAGISAGLWRKLSHGTIALEHAWLGGHFDTGVLPEIGEDASAVTRLRVDGTFPQGRRLAYYSVSIDRFESDYPTTYARARVSGNFGNVFASNSLALRLSDGPMDLTGFLQLRRGTSRSALHLDVGYGIGATSGIQNARLSVDRRLSSALRAQYGVDYDSQRASAGVLSGSIYRMVGPLALGINAEADQRGAVKLSLQLTAGASIGDSLRSAEFSQSAVADSGSINLRVYLDRNVSGTFDKGDKLLPGIGFRADGRQIRSRTNAVGVCKVNRLSAGQNVTVGVDDDTLDDPCWVAAQPGVVVLVRPGNTVRADLGVIETAEIEGKVTGDAPPQGMIAQLLTPDGTVAYTSIVDEDVSYVFSRVRPGKYTLRVCDPAGAVVAERPLTAAPAAVLRGFDVKK